MIFSLGTNAIFIGKKFKFSSNKIEIFIGKNSNFHWGEMNFSLRNCVNCLFEFLSNGFYACLRLYLALSCNT